MVGERVDAKRRLKMSEDVDWNDYAATWDEDEAARAYSRAAFSSLERELSALGVMLDGKRVLDFGCGTGLLTEQLAPRVASVVCLDTASAMIAVLDEKAKAAGWSHIATCSEPLTRELLAKHPELKPPFDLIVASSVCAFVPHYPDTVALFAELLAPGGFFVQWDWEFNADDEDPFGLTRDGIRGAIVDAGLDVVRADTGFEVTFGEHTMRPLMGIGRKG